MSNGWGWPLQANKTHYFVDGRSLCRNWIYFGDVGEANDYSAERCRACVRRLEKISKEADKHAKNKATS